MLPNNTNQENAGTPPQPLGTERISKLITRYALTTLAALVINSVYNLTDALFVSWGVGDNAMGGVSVVFPFTIIQAAIATAVGGGAASIVSRRLGEGKPSDAGEVTLNAMAVFYSSAIIITAVGFIFMEPLLRLMGITGDVYTYAKEYFIIILAGNIFSTGFSSIIRAEGRMLYGLLIWVIPITLNIALDAVFILACGWGVSGAAAATVICQFISFAMSMLFFTRFTSQKFKGARLRLRSIGKIISIGLPSLVQTGGLAVVTMLINSVLSGSAGTLGVNSFAYVSRLLMYLVIPFTAVSQALAPVAGYNYGSGDMDRVKTAVKFSMAVSLIYSIAVAVLTVFLGGYMLYIFTTDADIIAFGTNALLILSASFIFMPFAAVFGALFQSTGRRIKPLIIFSAKPVFLIPLIFLFAYWFGISGIWWSYAVSEGLSALTAMIITVSRKTRRRLFY